MLLCVLCNRGYLHRKLSTEVTVAEGFGRNNQKQQQHIYHVAAHSLQGWA